MWRSDPATPEIRDRLGWLTVIDALRPQADALAAWTAEVSREYRHVVLLGMGGSSLAPLMFRDTFGAASGNPSLTVLDTTDPRAVAEVARMTAGPTLYLVSSKSGTTLETDCLFRYFWELHPERGREARFVAITDPHTPLAALAGQYRFRRTFLNPPDIGGRYAALSYFGLVPAAVLGVDVARLLDRAARMAQACGPQVPAAAHSGLRLGATLGEAALAGRNKVTLVLSRGIAGFGLWLEQLLAESTGKEGKGLIPVADEPLGSPEVYGSDRLFVALTLAPERDGSLTARLAGLKAAGHPVVHIDLEDRYDIGGECFRWEFATAVAGAVLGIHPFDQPDVASSKANTDAVLARGTADAKSAASGAELTTFLSGVAPGDYIALLAYLPPTPANDRRLAAIRRRLRDRLRVAVTSGYGPRYLHSTGQLHKGGPPTGHFLQITGAPGPELQIPGKPFGFGVLESAQAEGDLLALRRRGRPVLRLDGLELLEATASGA